MAHRLPRPDPAAPPNDRERRPWAGDEETQGLALVRAIQVLADSLQMKVIAEGIEEESQRQALLRVGCRYGQGFLFATPQPAETWLRADRPPLLA